MPLLRKSSKSPAGEGSFILPRSITTSCSVRRAIDLQRAEREICDLEKVETRGDESWESNNWSESLRIYTH